MKKRGVLLVFFIIAYFAVFISLSYAQDAPDEAPEAPPPQGSPEPQESPLEKCLKDFVLDKVNEKIKTRVKEINELTLENVKLALAHAEAISHTGLKAKIIAMLIKNKIRRNSHEISILTKEVNKLSSNKRKYCNDAVDNCLELSQPRNLVKRCVNYNEGVCKLEYETKKSECAGWALPETRENCLSEARSVFNDCKDEADERANVMILKEEVYLCKRDVVIFVRGKFRKGASFVKLPDTEDNICEQNCVITKEEARHVCREMFPPDELNDEDSKCSEKKDTIGDVAGYVEEALDHGIKCIEEINKKTGQNKRKRFGFRLKSKTNPEQSDTDLNQQIPDPSQDPADQPTMIEAVFRW